MATIGSQGLVPHVVDLGFLGTTSRGEIRLGREVTLGRVVQVMLLRPMSPSSARSFVDAVGRAEPTSRHPTLLTIHGVGHTDDGRVFTVVEYPAGGTLHRRLRGTGPLTVLDAIHVGERMATGLQRLHALGISHGAVSASSLVLDRWDRPQLADIGVAILKGLSGSQAVDIGDLATTVELTMTGTDDAGGDPARLRSLGIDPVLVDLLASCHDPDPAVRPTAAAVATAFRNLRRDVVAHRLDEAGGILHGEEPAGVSVILPDTPPGLADPSSTPVVVHGGLEVVAGQGLQVGGPATRLRLVRGEGIVVTADGGYFVADRAAHRVYHVDPDSTVRVAAGTGHPAHDGDGGPATSASLNDPYGLAIHHGDLYITDRGNGVVRRVDTDGTIETVAGGAGSRLSVATPPHAIAVDAAGRVFVSLLDPGTVLVVTPDGEEDVVAGSTPSAPADDAGPTVQTVLDVPTGLAMDGPDLLVLELGRGSRSDGRVRRLVEQPTGGWKIQPVPGGDGLDRPEGIAANPDGAVLVTNTFDNQVVEIVEGQRQVVAGDGRTATDGDGGAATAAGLNRPKGIAVGDDGTVLVSEGAAPVVRRVVGGQIDTVVGRLPEATDVAAARLPLVLPTAIDTTPAGGIVVADVATGEIHEISGGRARIRTQGIAEIHAPGGIAVSDDGTIYISDTLEHVVYALGLDGVLEVVAGQVGRRATALTEPTLGDGVPAVSALLSFPRGLDVHAGTLYIADSGSHRIRAVDAEGIIRTVVGSGSTGGLADGPARQAVLDTPFDVDVAGDRLIIADAQNHAVRQLHMATGAVTTLAGSGRAGSGGGGGEAEEVELSLPQAVSMDRQGRVTIADTRNRRVLRITDDRPTTLLGAEDLPSLRPVALGVGADGRVYVVDQSSRRIWGLSR